MWDDSVLFRQHRLKQTSTKSFFDERLHSASNAADRVVIEMVVKVMHAEIWLPDHSQATAAKAINQTQTFVNARRQGLSSTVVQAQL